MKILNKFAFAVFAVLALAVVAGCSVDVLPAEDGGGTTAGGDGATGDDVSPGDDADVGGDDGSTGNEGIGTVPIDANGNAQLAGECKSETYRQNEFEVRLDVGGESGATDEVELQIGQIHRTVANGETLDDTDRTYVLSSILETIRANTESPVARTPITIFNGSTTNHLRIELFGLYRSRRDAGLLQNSIWEQLAGYPEVAPGKTIEIGLVEQPDTNVSVTPYCEVHVW